MTFQREWTVIVKLEVYGNVKVLATSREEAIDKVYKMPAEKVLKGRKEMKVYVMGAFEGSKQK
jgi:hypothetical protein